MVNLMNKKMNFNKQNGELIKLFEQNFDMAKEDIKDKKTVIAKELNE